MKYIDRLQEYLYTPQYLAVLSSEIIEKNLYKICILYIKDTTNETSFI